MPLDAPHEMHTKERRKFPGREAELPPTTSPREQLCWLLGVSTAHGAMPPLSEVLRAILLLAKGQRRKVLVPVASSPHEFSFLRRGLNVLVSFYGTESHPDVVILDRRVALRDLMDLTLQALLLEQSGGHEDNLEELVRDAEYARVEIAPDLGLSAMRCLGGAQDEPEREELERDLLVFGYEAAIFPGEELAARETNFHADVHAMLFGGTLWAFTCGRRVVLHRGSILLVVHRMVSIARALVQAETEKKMLNVRTRVGTCVLGVRREKGGEVLLSLGSDEDGVVTVPTLDVARASLPILRLASDLLRTIFAIDRSQTRNLRILSLRDEVRRLRKLLRSMRREVDEAVVASGTTDYLIGHDESPVVAESRSTNSSAKRYAREWSNALHELDVGVSFVHGEKWISYSPSSITALDRRTGALAYAEESQAALTVVAEQSILRVHESSCSLFDLEDGELIFSTSLPGHLHASGIYAGFGPVPPSAVLCDREGTLWSLDLRTGEPRWRHVSRGPSEFKLQRFGRLLVAVGSDTRVTALDLQTGELAWRLVAPARVCLPPVLIGDTVVLVTGELGRGEAELIAVSARTGAVRNTLALGGPATRLPVVVQSTIIVPTTRGDRATIQGYSADLTLLFERADPGFGSGAGVAVAQGHCVINTATGRVSAIDAVRGETLWQRHVTSSFDEVPRNLDPVFSGDHLLIPSSRVEMLSSAGEPTAFPECDVVPDSVIVAPDDWVYVAEDSGSVVAFAPVAKRALSLV